MAYRELELTLLSAQDLKSVNLITRMDVYAVVSISGNPLTRQCTEPDTYGGRNPCWNATFRFAVPATTTAAAASSLHVLLRAERFLGDRDVGEVTIPLHEILAGASGVGPQPPQVASYQVRKLHRYEPRGVLNVSYRLGPVVAPVLADRPPEKPVVVYAPVGVPPQPPHQQHPSAVPYQPPPHAGAAAGPPVGRVVAEHDHKDAAQNKSPVVMAYPAVGVPQQQQQHASHPPAKPDAYRSPSTPTPPSPRPAAKHEEAPARAPAAAPAASPARAPSPGNTRRSNDGFGQQQGPTHGFGQQQPGPTHVYMGPHSQIIFGGGSSVSTTAGGGPPTRTTTASPARPIISPPTGNKGDGNWAPLLTHQGGGNYAASAADSMSVSVISPRSRMEDRWRPSVLSQSQQQKQETARSPVAAPSPSPQRLAAAAASPFSSRSSSFSSSPLSPYSSSGSTHPSPSPSSLGSAAHSSTRSPYSSSAHPSSATTSPKPQWRSPAVSGAAAAAEVTHVTNDTFRSISYRGTAVSSPLTSSSSPLVSRT